MARPKEKAQNMLNRFLRAKQEELGVVKPSSQNKRTRPWRTSEVEDLPSCERYRSQVLREIGAKVLEIQNASLGEAALRDLNDAINKLIREKGSWERRIVELGGKRYAQQPSAGGNAGDGAVSAARSDGYRYFGAAKDLPGVKELFEAPPAQDRKRSRAEMLRAVDTDYYGFRDDDTGALADAELSAERKLRNHALTQWEKSRRAAEDAAKASGADAHVLPSRSVDEALELAAVHDPLPGRAEIEARMLEHKKQELLARLS